jgi:hypothetical protein
MTAVTAPGGWFSRVGIRLVSQGHCVGRRAIAATQLQELLGKPYQGGAIRVHAWQKIQHLVCVTDALRKEIALFLLKADLCRHSVLLTSHHVGGDGRRLDLACAPAVSAHLSLSVRVIGIPMGFARRFAVPAPTRSLIVTPHNQRHQRCHWTAISTVVPVHVSCVPLRRSWRRCVRRPSPSRHQTEDTPECDTRRRSGVKIAVPQRLFRAFTLNCVDPGRPVDGTAVLPANFSFACHPTGVVSRHLTRKRGRR